MEHTISSLEKLKEDDKQADQFAYLLVRLLLWVKRPNTRDAIKRILYHNTSKKIICICDISSIPK